MRCKRKKYHIDRHRNMDSRLGWMDIVCKTAMDPSQVATGGALIVESGVD